MGEDFGLSALRIASLANRTCLRALRGGDRSRVDAREQYCRIAVCLRHICGASIALRALELQNGSPVLRPSAESALPFFLGLIAILMVGYMIGKGVACLFRRSKVRFFRSYRNQ
jgi:hypothetical protein